ncbi:hypothetical protein TSTA_112240 [Talaromyces stipitatus ATCC 10500]|uniref:Uncharacterized protein n=1 Tax=Talaromyces stipitatus (strain ATCC 10500 / CBS 375.48 / QM 6759 / NRRL 1006) TaxID=441959 RepID=B8MAG7_TALSN|nr:uncharacterized protein TSTA_112240 [Talaromyces stipitatus ATCC 10500]EED17391.1 hypothetical protein TSTA_112240 [Talaromyces stipitatus ATCC 10500]
MEHDSPDISPTHSLMSYGIPDDMIRPISASESAVLSKYTSPAPSPGLPQSSHSFAALPPLKEPASATVSPRSPKSPAKTLKQKVSRLFGGSDKRSSPKYETFQENFDRHERDTPRSPLSGHWEVEESVKLIQQPASDKTASAERDNEDPSRHEFEELSSRRRPTSRSYSANRHQTLQDALRQLETENNGLTFEDIMRYIGVEDEDRIVSADDDDDGVHDERVERPWQPDTWNEPTQIRMPHNRPSNSNLSTSAPSTRASIRPYVERAAAFMATTGTSSGASSLSSDLAEAKHDMGNVELINGDEDEFADEEEEYEEEDKGHTTEDDNEETAPALRIVSRRARPLSSNPPDLDTPILYDSEPEDDASTPPSPNPQPVTRISWCPEIPVRHPDHRYIRFEDIRVTTPPPPQISSAPRVVTTTIAPRKKQRKHCKFPVSIW